MLFEEDARTMKLQTERPEYDELIRLMEVFSGDKDLLNWFFSLQTMNENVRSSHLRSMADGMRTNRERPDLIAAVESLMSPKFFQSAIKTVQSLDH
jgi:succinate dehydrogenase flavin-adding protein (antitoxin of CptAB toxin-antitoxin module)